MKPTSFSSIDLYLEIKLMTFFAPRWSSLKNIGNSRKVKSTLIWIFIVPTAIKIIEAIPRKIGIPFTSTVVDFQQFYLPFNWVIMYFAAIMFSLASIIYLSRCPSIIKKYSNYSGIEKLDLGVRKLVELYFEVFATKYNESSLVTAQKNANKIMKFAIFASNINQFTGVPMIDLFELEIKAGKTERSIYSFVYAACDCERRGWSISCIICYALGFIALGIVALQNAFWALKPTAIYLYNLIIIKFA
jgi:hypothetical protein